MSMPPSFGPGSGWYQPGQMTPGSMRDREAMCEAAFPCSVVVLRRRGFRIPTTALVVSEPPTGWLLCMDRYTHPKWHACLFADEQMQRQVLPRLLHAQLVAGERRRAPVRRDRGGRPRPAEFLQAWLCTPTPERAREILLAMLEQEVGDLDA